MKTRRRVRPRFFLFVALGTILIVSIVSFLLRPRMPATASRDPAPSQLSVKSVPHPHAFYTLTPFGLPQPLKNFGLIGIGPGVFAVAGGRTTTGLNGTVYTLTENGAVMDGNLAQPRQNGGLIDLGANPVYIGGVDSQNISQASEEFLSGGKTLSVLPQGLSRFAIAYNGRTTYLVGGEGLAGASPDIYRISEQGQASLWSQLPIALVHPMAEVFQGALYVAGGTTASGAISSTIYRIPLTNGRPEPWAKMPLGLTDGALVLLDHHLWLLGGSTGSHLSNAVWVIDHHTLIPTQSLPVPLAGFATAYFGNAVWILGGQTPQGLSSTIYVLEANH
ncbi:MAG: hypothetical protein C7B46_08865 [Sulfobacillus benefaciens]|uniref:Galactose oxidase n=1 Tax=Sulfobacillus benefaciens TaxID=453960 RepID=A0A2T2XGX0_9FIRM|nr:MAG: hypothetical protein C7B46_08865 [Sulfobacillus benefaciens]